MKLTPDELVRLDAAIAAGGTPPMPLPLPDLDENPTTVATLLRYRRARLAPNPRAS